MEIDIDSLVFDDPYFLKDDVHDDLCLGCGEIDCICELEEDDNDWEYEYGS